MPEKIERHRAGRDLFRKQAVDRFVQGGERGVPDGTWRSIPGLLGGAAIFAALALLMWLS